jgi:hypothetical protein
MSYPTIFTTPGLRAFAEAVDTERQAQLAKFGDQHHPDGTAADFTARAMRDSARVVCDAKAQRGALTWADVLDEEYWEARAETDPAKLRAELVQVAAVCAAWITDLDSRTTAAQPAVEEQPAEVCGKCRRPFDSGDDRYDGRARFYLTPYCRRCVAACHDNEIADHRCVICA